jgi:two-component system sensor histidine kinase/response regulator
MPETLRILTVDDEPGMRTGVMRVLKDYAVRMPEVEDEVAFVTDHAATGEEALEKIQAAPPDILLLDYKLPGISGLDVLDQVVSGQPDILVIMITAYASLETAIAATKRGAYDFLAKPFTPEELRNAVRKAAGRMIVTRQARKLAQEKRQARFEFISVLAHELKAPICAIEGYLHILKDPWTRPDPAMHDRMLDRCLVRAEQMRIMILDLLDLTRIESGLKKREPVELDLVEVARAALEIVAAEAKARNVTLELHAASPLKLTADRLEMEMILNNLVSNAVKYNRDGGRVDVTLSASDGRVTISVADTGIGLTPEEAGRLFTDFGRVRNDKTRHILGSGLGLSIVRKLADLYHGRVSVASQPGAGSTFTVELETGADATAIS